MSRRAKFGGRGVCALCMKATRAFSFCGESQKGQIVRASAVSRQIRRHNHAEHCLRFVIKQHELIKLGLFSLISALLSIFLVCRQMAGWVGESLIRWSARLHPSPPDNSVVQTQSLYNFTVNVKDMCRRRKTQHLRKVSGQLKVI